VHATHNNQIKKEPGLRPVPIIQSVMCDVRLPAIRDVLQKA